MADDLKPIDVRNSPDLLRLVEEVGRSGKARVLRGNDEALAIISPLTPVAKRGTRRPKTTADIEAFRAAAGSWKDVDTDKLLAEIRESRRSSRPLVDL